MLVGRLRSCTGFGEMKVEKKTGKRTHKKSVLSRWNYFHLPTTHFIVNTFLYTIKRTAVVYIHTCRVILPYISEIVVNPYFFKNFTATILFEDIFLIGFVLSTVNDSVTNERRLMATQCFQVYKQWRSHSISKLPNHFRPRELIYLFYLNTVYSVIQKFCQRVAVNKN